MVGGTAKDVQYTIAALAKDGKPFPQIVLLNLPRSQRNHLSYAGIESVKDGLFNSAKYESAMVVFNPPHMVIFANEEPEYEKLSGDRWSVHNLSGEPKTPMCQIPPPPPKNTTQKTTGWELKLVDPNGRTATATVQPALPLIPTAVAVDEETKSECSEDFDMSVFDLDCDKEFSSECEFDFESHAFDRPPSSVSSW